MKITRQLAIFLSNQEILTKFIEYACQIPNTYLIHRPSDIIQYIDPNDSNQINFWKTRDYEYLITNLPTNFPTPTAAPSPSGNTANYIIPSGNTAHNIILSENPNFLSPNPPENPYFLSDYPQKRYKKAMIKILIGIISMIIASILFMIVQ